MKKIWLLALVASLVLLFFALDLNDYLTFESIKAGLVQFEAWRAGSPLLFGSAFFALYVIVTALSLPGAIPLTLVAGALFGLVWGLVIVSFASTIGATLAFLMARYLLRESLEKRFSDRLKAINKEMESDGAFYLLTLRLVPLFPFFVINLVMGLTSLSARRFYWVSQVGMLAGSVVYVNAGTRLAELKGLSGIFSPAILMSFALLGLFPLFARGLLRFLKRRRVYSKWQKPKQFDRNLVVIGAGAGGLVSSYIAAAVNAKVTLVEAHKMGGDCLNYGCVPSKALIKSAKVAHQMRHADRYGLEANDPQFSFRSVMARIHHIIREIAPHDSVERYAGLGVEVLQGYAEIVDPWTVDIKLNDGESQRLTTRSIIIAAGAQPFVPPLPGLDDVGYVTSDTLWDEFARLDSPPQRLVVLGGGPIGCELSQAFARLGSQVTQIEMAERIMVREDAEVSALVQQSLESDGVRLLTRHKALRCELDGAGENVSKVLIVENEGEEQRIEFDHLLVAVGRAARLSGYGLETLGIPTDRIVETNEYLETIYPNIYAAGDVVGPYQFTHAAAHMAWYASVNALFGQFKRFKVDYSVLPWTTFVDPEVARVGLNEQDAADQGIEYEVTRYEMAELDRAIADSNTQGFVKVLTPPGKDKILGVTFVGSHSGELLAEFVLAMRHGLGLNKILGTIHTYPTLAEANKYVAGNWKKAHAPARLLRWVARYHRGRREGMVGSLLKPATNSNGDQK